MDIMHERVAGLDVHKQTVVACVRLMAGGRARRECRSFETTTAGLLELLAWLTQSGCTQVAMEATGVYWMPVWKSLGDGGFELIVAHVAHIKAVPGRKPDLNDAMGIADLLACGLIHASFVPEEDIQELRALMRTRKQVVREQTRHTQRIQKTLEEANIKLDCVISDLMGASGRRMIEAMVEGQRSPQKLAALAGRGLKASPKQLYDALHGRVTEHHRFLLKLHLAQWDGLEAMIHEVDAELDQRVLRLDQEGRDGQAPFREMIGRLCGIPGLSMVSATSILAEIGRDMGRFATAGHLVAWAGLCPGQNESAGRQKSTRLRKGAPGTALPCLPPADRFAMAEDHAGAVRLGGQAQEGQLLQGAVPPAARIATSAPATSTAAPLTAKRNACSPSSPNLASRPPCSRSTTPRDAHATPAQSSRPKQQPHHLATSPQQFLVRSACDEAIQGDRTSRQFMRPWIATPNPARNDEFCSYEFVAISSKLTHCQL